MVQTAKIWLGRRLRLCGFVVFATALAMAATAHAATIELTAATVKARAPFAAMAAIPAPRPLSDAYDFTTSWYNGYPVSLGTRSIGCDTLGEEFIVFNEIESAAQIALQKDLDARPIVFQPLDVRPVDTASPPNASLPNANPGNASPGNASPPNASPRNFNRDARADQFPAGGFCPRSPQIEAKFTLLDFGRQCFPAAICPRESCGERAGADLNEYLNVNLDADADLNLREICLPSNSRCDRLLDRTPTAAFCPWSRQINTPEITQVDFAPHCAWTTTWATTGATTWPLGLWAKKATADLCERPLPSQARYGWRADGMPMAGFCPASRQVSAPECGPMQALAGMQVLAGVIEERPYCPRVDATIDAGPEAPHVQAATATVNDSPPSATQPSGRSGVIDLKNVGPAVFVGFTSGVRAWAAEDASRPFQVCLWIEAPGVQPPWVFDRVLAAPEPSTLMLMLIGLLGLGYARYRKTTKGEA